MTYNVKTAIRVVRESDIPQVIPFFQKIKPDCNNLGYIIYPGDIQIGYTFFINEDGVLDGYTTETVYMRSELSDYSILNGIPENWREEMETPKNIHREIADQYQDLFNLLSKEHGLILIISEMDNIVIEAARISEYKINQLETENKELIERLNKSGNNLIEECGKTAKLRDKNLTLKQRINELEDLIKLGQSELYSIHSVYGDKSNAEEHSGFLTQAKQQLNN